MHTPLRVVVAEADATLRSALLLLLSYEEHVHLAGVAANITELTELLTNRQVDVLLVDWDLPGWRPDRLTGHLSGVRVVGLGARPERCRQVLADGAHAYVSKLDSPSGLINALSGTRRCGQD